MKAGRPPKHSFHTLEVGETIELRGKAKKYPYQYAYQYRKGGFRALRINREGKKIFATRIK